MNACTHCDESILVPIFDEKDTNQEMPFCCNGCLTVFNILREKGLENYYSIKKSTATFKRRSPVESTKSEYQYLDQEDFIKEYTYTNLKDERTIEFFLEGIHCLACLWLIEKLPEFLKDVSQSRLDMNRSVVTISLVNEGLFSRVAKELNRLGYKPHPLKRNQSIVDLKRNEDRRMLLKIGIAGAGAGNIMIYAVSNYAGAKGVYAEVFNYLTIVFAIPVLFYSATPFYTTAWNAIKTKSLSIDIPISISLLLGTSYGVYNLFQGITENYLDGLTTLIFLLLISRYFLNKIQSDGLNAGDFSNFNQSESVLKKIDSQFIDTHIKYIFSGDIVKVLPNQIIPVDGIITDGSTSINNSLLTGESKPVEADIGQNVFSGTLNLGREIQIRVEKSNQDTRLGQILKQVESGWNHKAHIVEFTNKVSKYFLMVIIALATILLVTLSIKGQTKTGIERAITLLIVTCPCALALATPLTLTRTLSRASKKGIIIKDDEVIEKITQIKSVFLDKTGTITYGQLKISNLEQISKTIIPLYEIIVSLERQSLHPVAIALKEFSQANCKINFYNVKDLKEILGVGVEGWIEDQFYEIKKGKIYENNKIIAKFSLEDKVRNDSERAIKEIREMGINVALISGDQSQIVDKISNEVGIEKSRVFSEVSPEQKLKMIEENPKSLMVGDGANDAMALSKSYVGVAVMGAMDISLRAADIFLATPGIASISDLFVISHETMKVVKRNLIISLIYNCFSIYAAYTGLITPLVAAIIMPISSLTVLLSTIIGTKNLNQKLSIN